MITKINFVFLLILLILNYFSDLVSSHYNNHQFINTSTINSLSNYYKIKFRNHDYQDIDLLLINSTNDVVTLFNVKALHFTESSDFSTKDIYLYPSEYILYGTIKRYQTSSNENTLCYHGNCINDDEDDSNYYLNVERQYRRFPALESTKTTTTAQSLDQDIFGNFYTVRGVYKKWKCKTSAGCTSFKLKEINNNNIIQVKSITSEYFNHNNINRNHIDQFWLDHILLTLKPTLNSIVFATITENIDHNNNNESNNSIQNSFANILEIYVNLPDPVQGCIPLKPTPCPPGQTLTFVRKPNRCFASNGCTLYNEDLCSKNSMRPACPKSFRLEEYPSRIKKGCAQHLCEPDFLIPTKSYKLL